MPALLSGKQLPEFERGVEIADGELPIRFAADQPAHDAAVQRAAFGSPEDRAADRLDFLDLRVGLELADDLLRVDVTAHERDIGAHACVAHPGLRNRVNDPFVARAVEHDAVRLLAFKEDVSACDIGGDAVEAERLDARLQLPHLDQCLPTDVDPPQERDVSHRASLCATIEAKPGRRVAAGTTYPFAVPATLPLNGQAGRGGP